MQYMCSPLVRDGTTTRTIPTKATECYRYDCDTDVRFGRHESLDFYEMCTKTSRNMGLFNANQNLKGNAAKYTRQNPNGNRHAYECPEERDHYPYWRPSPWIDALIVTADIGRCEGYQAESQNVKARGECRMPDAFFDAGHDVGNGWYPITQAECEGEDGQLTRDGTTYQAEWNVVPAHGVDAPGCELVGQTRANHLGNPGGRTLYGTTWTIPDTIEAGSQCVMRLRYNITTADYQAWESGASMTPGLDADANSKDNPNPGNDPAEYALWEDYGLTRTDVEGSFGENGKNDAQSREYVLVNNPQVDAFGTLLTDANAFSDGTPTEIKMQLAVNTAQFGRTFQDRTHYFIVEDRPADVPADAVIKLQTVRGKRGNIVQTYPATEYFMHPEVNWVRAGEYVHFEWTGSNTNPNNNDGQGKQGTDRSNFVAQRVEQYSTEKYSNFEWDMAFDEGLKDQGSAMTSYPGYVKRPDGYIIPDFLLPELNEASFGGISEDIRVKLATGRQMLGDHGNMEELDDASTSVNLPPQKMRTVGCTNYLCTRNNNFSNRAQKGKFCVAAGDVGEVMVGIGGAEWWDTNESTSVTWWPNSVAGGQERAHIIVKYEEDTAVVSVTDINLIGTMTVTTAYVPRSLNSAKLMWQAECATRASECENAWEEVPFEAMMVNGASVASADVTNTGTFKVIHKPNVGPIIALTVAVLAFTGAIAWVLLNKCGDRCPKRLQALKWENMRGGKKGGTSVQTGESGPPAFTGAGKTEI